MRVRADSVAFTYNPGTPLEVSALADVSFTLPSGSALGIVGGTGSGKTTLIKLLNGLLRPTSGAVYLDEREIGSYGEEIRRRIGVVFQRPERQLFGETIFGDVSFVLRRFSDLSKKEIRERVAASCRRVGLDLDAVGDLSPLRVSDGIKRKASLAAVLVNDPKVFVLDEPAVGLDVPSVADLVKTLSAMKTHEQRSIVIVSHDMGPFLDVVDALLVLDRGRVLGFGPTEEICEHLEDGPRARSHLPEQVLLAENLRKAGHALPKAGLSIGGLADLLADASRGTEAVT